MIIQDRYWINVVPQNWPQGYAVDGKWLFFGDTNRLHQYALKIDEMVESGELHSAKIARKLPDTDPFPEKPCVICFFTSADANERARVKLALELRLGISVTAWKSEEQTERDWQDGGLLAIQAELIQLRRAIKAGQISDYEKAQQQVDDLAHQLQGLVRSIDDPQRRAEIELSFADAAGQAPAGAPADVVILSRLGQQENMASEVLFKLGESSTDAGVPTSPAGPSSRASLRQDFQDHFSETDLQELCFDHDIDYESLPGSNKRAKVMELIMYFEKRGRLEELVGIYHSLRPGLE